MSDPNPTLPGFLDYAVDDLKIVFPDLFDRARQIRSFQESFLSPEEDETRRWVKTSDYSVPLLLSTLPTTLRCQSTPSRACGGEPWTGRSSIAPTETTTATIAATTTTCRIRLGSAPAAGPGESPFSFSPFRPHLYVVQSSSPQPTAITLSNVPRTSSSSSIPNLATKSLDGEASQSSRTAGSSGDTAQGSSGAPSGQMRYFDIANNSIPLPGRSGFRPSFVHDNNHPGPTRPSMPI